MAGICALLVGAAAASAQSLSGGAMFLPEDYLPGLRPILTAALQQSNTMLEQNIRLAQAEASRIQAAVGLYPSLSVNGGYSHNDASSDSGGSNSTSSSSGLNYGIGFGQNVFQWGAVRANAEIGRLGEQVSRRSYAEAFRTLLVALRSQYLGLILKKAGLERMRFQATLAQNDLQDIKDGVTRGVRAGDEVGGADLTAQRAQLNADRAAEDFDSALRVFNRLSGQAALAADAIPAGLPEPSLATAMVQSMLMNFLGRGVQETPQAQSFALQVRQSDLSYKIARTGLWPKLSAGAGYNSGSNTYVDGIGRVSQSVVASRSYSVSFGWTLYDAGNTRAAKLNALSNRRMLERQAANYTAATRDEATHRARGLELEGQSLAIAELDRRISQNNLRVVREDLEDGKVSRVEIDRAIASFQGTELAAFTARANYLQQWVEFVSLVGADPMMNQLPASYLSHGQ
jgi:outer membrane protein TolC